VRRDGEHISLLDLSSLRAHAAPKRTLAMGIFEPLIELRVEVQKNGSL